MKKKPMKSAAERKKISDQFEKAYLAKAAQRKLAARRKAGK